VWPGLGTQRKKKQEEAKEEAKKRRKTAKGQVSLPLTHPQGAGLSPSHTPTCTNSNPYGAFSDQLSLSHPLSLQQGALSFAIEEEEEDG